MSERLEDFIKNNKKDFDEYDVPSDLWNRIEKQLDERIKDTPRKEKVVRLSFLLKIAAAFVIVVISGVLVWKYQEKEATNLADIDPKLAEQQLYYTSLITEKRSELQQIEKLDPLLYKEFSSEIKKMDENYQKLKNDLPASPNQEETVKAMIRSLQIQIRVLNQQLRIIEQVDQFKKEQDHETQSI